MANFPFVGLVVVEAARDRDGVPEGAHVGEAVAEREEERAEHQPEHDEGYRDGRRLEVEQIGRLLACGRAQRIERLEAFTSRSSDIPGGFVPDGRVQSDRVPLREDEHPLRVEARVVVRDGIDLRGSRRAVPEPDIPEEDAGERSDDPLAEEAVEAGERAVETGLLRRCAG